ncbi:MAG: hypothetical protein LC734_04050 [Acidobacteria bacterium]|nr:hypothetical protein [Acidobacteriota bacterium]
MPIFNKKNDEQPPIEKVWARPEMLVVFRAEIMPGRSREERTFKVKTVRPNGRVILYDFPDEQSEGAFEPINFQRNLGRR